ncbi:hypothetical protein Efla_006675 [Eimeria flavescens]
MEPLASSSSQQQQQQQEESVRVVAVKVHAGPAAYAREQTPAVRVYGRSSSSSTELVDQAFMEAAAQQQAAAAAAAADEGGAAAARGRSVLQRARAGAVMCCCRLTRWHLLVLFCLHALFVGPHYLNWAPLRQCLLYWDVYGWLCEPTDQQQQQRELQQQRERQQREGAFYEGDIELSTRYLASPSGFPLGSAVGQQGEGPLYPFSYPAVAAAAAAEGVPWDGLERGGPGGRGPGAQHHGLYPAACKEQEIAIARLFAITTASDFGVSFMGGLLLDAWGPKAASTLGTLSMLLGCVFVGISSASLSLHIVGFVFYGLGVDAAFYGVISLPMLFPKNEGLVMTVLMSFRCLAWGTPVLLERLASPDTLGLSAHVVMLGVQGSCLFAAVFIALLFIPRTPFQRPPHPIRAAAAEPAAAAAVGAPAAAAAPPPAAAAAEPAGGDSSRVPRSASPTPSQNEEALLEKQRQAAAAALAEAADLEEAEAALTAAAAAGGTAVRLQSLRTTSFQDNDFPFFRQCFTSTSLAADETARVSSNSRGGRGPPTTLLRRAGGPFLLLPSAHLLPYSALSTVQAHQQRQQEQLQQQQVVHLRVCVLIAIEQEEPRSRPGSPGGEPSSHAPSQQRGGAPLLESPGVVEKLSPSAASSSSSSISRRRRRVRLYGWALLRARAVACAQQTRAFVVEFVFSSAFFPIIPYFVLTLLRGVFFGESSEYLVPQAMRGLHIMLGLVFIYPPLLGVVADRAGEGVCLVLVNSLGALLMGLSLLQWYVPEKALAYCICLCYAAYAPLMSGQVYLYILKAFPQEHLGKLLGLAMTIGGFFSLIATPLFELSVHRNSNFPIVLAAFLGLSFIAFAFIWCSVRGVNKNKRAAAAASRLANHQQQQQQHEQQQQRQRQQQQQQREQQQRQMQQQQQQHEQQQQRQRQQQQHEQQQHEQQQQRQRQQQQQRSLAFLLCFLPRQVASLKGDGHRQLLAAAARKSLSSSRRLIAAGRGPPPCLPEGPQGPPAPWGPSFNVFPGSP